MKINSFENKSVSLKLGNKTMTTLPDLNLENNLYQFYENFIGFEDFMVNKCNHYDFISSKKYQWPGFVYNLEANHENCDQLINELEKKILSKEIPPFLLVDPKRIPDDFENKISQIGISKIDYWPIIFYDLKKKKLQLKNISDFNIIEIRDVEQLRLWYNIVVSVLFPGKSVSFDFFHQHLNDPGYLFHLGYVGKTPVSSFMVFMNNRIAGTFMGATVNEFRKRGYGSEIMIRALLDAEKAGCLYATGQSSRMGFPVWQQVGFSSANNIDIYWMIGEKYK